MSELLEQEILWTLVVRYSKAFSDHSTDELAIKLLPDDVFEYSSLKNFVILIRPSVIKSDWRLSNHPISDMLLHFLTNF